MKELKRLIMIMLVTMVLAWVISRVIYTISMLPQWQQQQIEEHTQNMLHKEIRERAWDTTWERVGVAVGWGTEILLIAIPLVCAGSWIYIMISKRNEAWARQKDGGYALQERKFGDVVWMVDPNKMFGSATGFHSGTGQLTEFNNPVAGADRQLDYNKSVQKTRNIAALTDSGPMKYAAQAKWMAGAYDRNEAPKIQPVEAPPPPPPTLLTLQEAFETNNDKPGEWVVGQNQETGATYTVNLRVSPHLAVIGASGTGKTKSVGLMLVAYALHESYQVIVLDGKAQGDWDNFKSLFSVYDMDASNAFAYVKELERIASSRKQILKTKGIADYWKQEAKCLHPLMVIVDDFGAPMDALKVANPKAYNDTAKMLDHMFRLCRSVGMHFVLCDQYPKSWPKVVRSNMPVHVCFNTDTSQSGVIGEYIPRQMLPVGQFVTRGMLYNSWDVSSQIHTLLPEKHYRKYVKLLGPVVDSTATNIDTAEPPDPADPPDSMGVGVGGVKPQNRPYLPPTMVQPVQPVQVSHTPVGAEPVGGSGGGSASSTGGSSGSGEPPTVQPVVQPLLTGDVVTDDDIAILREAFKRNNGSINATCRAVWGDSKTPSLSTQKRRVKDHCK